MYKRQKYLRVQVRKLIKEFQNKGLDRKKFITTIKNLKHSNNVVDYYVNENLKKNTFFSSKKKKLIIKTEYFNQPFEVILRSLSESIKFVGERSHSVRGKKLARIISKIEKNSFYKQTLGGCVIEKVNQTLILSKEH